MLSVISNVLIEEKDANKVRLYRLARIFDQLRTVPTIVNAHKFCTSHKAWFAFRARYGLHQGWHLRNQGRYQVRD